MNPVNLGPPLKDLNYSDRTKVCEILDSSNKWEELGKLMKLPDDDLETVRRAEQNKKSPSKTLLSMWGEIYSHFILELFVLLSKIGLYKAMVVLKPYVDSKYWYLIKNQNEEPPARRQPVQDTNVPSQNFDKTTKKNINYTKGNNPAYSNENNASHTMTEASQTHNESLASVSKSPVEKQETEDDALRKTMAGTLFTPYVDLVVATNSWDRKNILGQGGFGTVYSGTWHNTKVAIKKIRSNVQEEQIRELIIEVHCAIYRHDNILPLYGYSFLKDECACLIYKYMPGGSLDHRLKTSNPNKLLDWKSRMKIAIGVARGLQYLHNAPTKPLIHGDIKSANILLDLNNEPAIGDFGLVREGPARNEAHKSLTKVHGTKCYLPLDFMRSGHLTCQVDTYSFGVVLFELATGRLAAMPYSTNNSKEETAYLKSHIPKYPEERLLELKDRRVSGGEHEYFSLIKIGLACVKEYYEVRPLMKDVLIMLENTAVLR